MALRVTMNITDPARKFNPAVGVGSTAADVPGGVRPAADPAIPGG